MGARRIKSGWQADFRIQQSDGRIVRIRQTFRTRKEAEIFEQQAKADALRGIYNLPALKAIPFAEASAEYRKWSRENKRSWMDDFSMLKWIDGEIGSMPLDRITPFLIEQLKHRLLKKGLSKARVNRYRSVISSVFTKCIKWGRYSGPNPVREVAKFREPAERIVLLSEEEIGRLLEACNDDLRRVVLVALNAGLRRGEIFALRWSDLHLESAHPMLVVRQSKSGQKREVPLNRTLAAMFKEMKADKRHLEFVFVKPDGSPYREIARRSPMRTAWQVAVEKSELTGLRFHDLRHCFATELAARGVGLRTLQQLLGHKTLEMVMRYSHVSDAAMRDAVSKLDSDGHFLDTLGKNRGLRPLACAGKIE